jgi:hypothetical protein
LRISLKNRAAGSSLHWGLAGVLLACPLLFLSYLSPDFHHDVSDIDKPIVMLVILLISASVVYLYIVFRLKNTRFTPRLMTWVFLLGLLIRLGMFHSAPILEDDHFRYLWDGGVLANGYNPYRYAPREILQGDDQKIPQALRDLAEEGKPNPQNANYPWLRTIYPPVTQSAFAMAHLIEPWSLPAWRFVLLVMDATTLVLLFLILRRLDYSYMGLVIYWWNPLLVKEIYNSGHMEVVILPFLLGALLLATHQKYLLASAALGLAFGAKFWPALLVPVLLRPLSDQPKRLMSALTLFLVLAFFMFLPFYLTGLDYSSGLRAYGSQWQMNDSLFQVLLWLVDAFCERTDLTNPRALTRILVAILLSAWVLWLVRVKEKDPSEMFRRSLLVVAALFLLSPTQFPWYYLWMLPLLAVTPRFSLLILTALLPLYYLRFYFNARDMVFVHDVGIVWVEFVPIWILLLWEYYNGRKRPKNPPACPDRPLSSVFK